MSGKSNIQTYRVSITDRQKPLCMPLLSDLDRQYFVKQYTELKKYDGDRKAQVLHYHFFHLWRHCYLGLHRALNYKHLHWKFRVVEY